MPPFTMVDISARLRASSWTNSSKSKLPIQKEWHGSLCVLLELVIAGLSLALVHSSTNMLK